MTRDRPVLSPLNVTACLLALATMAAVIFLTSPPPGMTPSGARPWGEGSWLKALTDALALNFALPTPLGFEIKDLAGGVMAAVLLAVVAVGCYLEQRRAAWEMALEPEPGAAPAWRRQIEPHAAAAGLLVAFLALSLASMAWSPLPELAYGGSVALALQVAWALGLRWGLGRGGCRVLAAGMTVLLVAAALLNLWYIQERNATMREGYPIGNPLFFAACLIPAVFVSMAGALHGVQRRGWKGWGLVLAGCAAVAVLGWAIVLADPRSTYVGLAAGLAAMILFLCRTRRARWVAAALIAVGAVLVYVFWLAPKIAARPQTVRTRLYAWRYAQELIAGQPIRGHGQGSYTLLADSLAVQDAAADPTALDAWIDHAHNEWLEVMADLGSFGAVTMLAALVLTVIAGLRRLRQLPAGADRWLLTALMAALVAMVAEECTDVALRVAGLPTMFYAVLGMVWALSAAPREAAPRPAAGGLKAVLAVAAALWLAPAAIWDFQAARAQHELTGDLTGRRWDAALTHARLAARHRLHPARQLVGRSREAWCHLEISRAFLEDFLRTAQAADASPRARQLAEDYGRRAAQAAGDCLSATGRLTSLAPYFLGAAQLSATAHDVLARYQHAVGNAEAARDHAEQALEEYRRAWQREPYTPQVVLEIVTRSPDLSVAQMVELLAGPMRYQDVDPRFIQIVQQAAGRPEFNAEFAPIIEAAVGDVAKGQPPGPFAAETLRIAAWVSAGRGEMQAAANFADQALQWAEQRPDYPLASAAIGRELAHFAFLLEPQNPVRAAGLARRALTYLPARSHRAAATRASIQRRLAMYHVAAGREQAALAALDSDRLNSFAQRTRLAGAYEELCHILLGMHPALRPSYVLRCIDRYEMLMSEDYPPVPPCLMRGQHLVDTGHIDGGVGQWERALSLGAAPGQVLELLGYALQRHPDHPTLRAFAEQLAAALPAADAPTPAAAPTAAPPSDTPPAIAPPATTPSADVPPAAMPPIPPPPTSAQPTTAPPAAEPSTIAPPAAEPPAAEPPGSR